MDDLSIECDRRYRTKIMIKYLDHARTCGNCTNSTDEGRKCLKFDINVNKDASCSFHFIK